MVHNSSIREHLTRPIKLAPSKQSINHSVLASKPRMTTQLPKSSGWPLETAYRGILIGHLRPNATVWRVPWDSSMSVCPLPTPSQLEKKVPMWQSATANFSFLSGSGKVARISSPIRRSRFIVFCSVVFLWGRAGDGIDHVFPGHVMATVSVSQSVDDWH